MFTPQKASQSFAIRRWRNKIKSILSGGSAVRKIQLRPQVWNFCPYGAKIMRAVGLYSPSKERPAFLGTIKNEDAEASSFSIGN